MFRCKVKGCNQQAETCGDRSQPSKRTDHIYNPEAENPEYGFVISFPTMIKNGFCFYHNNIQGSRPDTE